MARVARVLVIWTGLAAAWTRAAPSADEIPSAEHIVVAQGPSIEKSDEKPDGATHAVPTDVVTRCTIRDPSGRLLANACVAIYPMGRKYRTDHEGCVLVSYPKPQDRAGLRAYLRHKAPAWLRAIRLPRAGGAVEVRLAEALSVCGRVTDPQGNPAGGVQIAALPMSDRYVRTDRDGCFDIAWDPSWAGRIRNLCLMARDADRNLAALVGITPETRNADLVLAPGLTLSGMVEDPNGSPVPHATVSMSLVRGWGCGTPVEPVKSDSRGCWQITALPQRQEYHISARAAGYGPGIATTGRINTTGPVAPVDPLVLKPRNRSVSGIVIDVNGLPVEGARVVLDGAGQPDQNTTTDREGRFAIAEICDGSFALYAARDRHGHRDGSGQLLEVQPNGARQEIVLFPERKKPAAREERPFEVDPRVGVLKYRWSDRGRHRLDGKDWQSIGMGPDGPANVELPNPGHGAALWGRWRNPAVKGGSRWIALVRAHARGQYDRLIVDANGDGRLHDEAFVAAYASSQPSESSYFAAFRPVEVLLDRSSGPPAVHLSFGFYGSDSELIIRSVGWYEGDVNVAGVKTRCLLADANADGIFGTPSSDPMSADLMGLGDEEHRTTHLLGKYVALDGEFYEVQVTEGRECLRVDFTPAESLPCGVIRLPEGISELAVAGENGCFTLHPNDRAVCLPAGTYRIIRWQAERDDEQGRRWTLTGHSFDDAARVEVAANGETSLMVGEPVSATLGQIRGTEPPYSFHGPQLTGRFGETVDLDCDVAGARLALRIWAGDGTYDRTFTFEYG